jgi:predicted nuclease with TOPRIM domain
MTFKDLTDMTMEQNDEYLQHVEVTTDISSTQHDETTTSSVDSASDDNERNDINRRGLKKSGGPVRKLALFVNKQVIKYSDEYHDRRIKNNEAVKKSRMKSKEKQKETAGKMQQLANENRSLNDRVDLLMKELQVLKSLYKELNQDLPISAVRALERVNLR